eukprot:NODE_765_length_4070_cov_0.612692.p2 type:complete len:211 gc:universal NODE_765_length_4070_cov_0.612692:1032-400(-)
MSGKIIFDPLINATCFEINHVDMIGLHPQLYSIINHELGLYFIWESNHYKLHQINTNKENEMMIQGRQTILDRCLYVLNASEDVIYYIQINDQSKLTSKTGLILLKEKQYKIELEYNWIGCKATLLSINEHKCDLLAFVDWSHQNPQIKIEKECDPVFAIVSLMGTYQLHQRGPGPIMMYKCKRWQYFYLFQIIFIILLIITIAVLIEMK